MSAKSRFYVLDTEDSEFQIVGNGATEQEALETATKEVQEWDVDYLPTLQLVEVRKNFRIETAQVRLKEVK